MSSLRARPPVILLLLLLTFLLVDRVSLSRAGGNGPSILVYPPFTHALSHRARSKHLRMFLGKSAEFLDPKAVDCVKLEAWDDEKTESDDDELFVVMVNGGRKELIFNNSMTSITRSRGDSGVEFREPNGVAVDRLGNVYVTDRALRAVIHMRLDDKNRLKFVKQFKGAVQQYEHFVEPMGVSVSHDGRVFVTDRSRNGIFVFDSLGRLVDIHEDTTTGPEGKKGIIQPVDIDVLSEKDPWNYFGQNSIYLLDMDGKRIQKLSMDWEREAVAYTQDLANNRAALTSIAVDYYSNVFATDVVNDCVHKFNRKLEYLGTFGERGTSDGQFLTPRGISIWKRYGQVFITDSTGVQYLWIGTDILPPAGDDDPAAVIRSEDDGRKSVSVSFGLVEPSEISMSIRTAKGEEIPLVEWRKYFARKVKLVLPVDEWKGESLEESVLVIRARATYSSKRSFEKKLTLPVTVIN